VSSDFSIIATTHSQCSHNYFVIVNMLGVHALLYPGLVSDD
jgi:hypothetical protein